MVKFVAEIIEIEFSNKYNYRGIVACDSQTGFNLIEVLRVAAYTEKKLCLDFELITYLYALQYPNSCEWNLKIKKNGWILKINP